MERVLISLGSNLGNRLQYLQRALEEIEKVDQTRVKAVSSVYEAEPVGLREQPEFLNAAVELRSNLQPLELFRALKEIERKLGRTQTIRWGPREIDIDIIYFGQRVVQEPELSIPHSEVTNRKFVLIPLSEIDREYLDPLRKCSVRELLAGCKDLSGLEKTAFVLLPPARES